MSYATAQARHVEVTLCQITCHEHTTALELTVRDDGIGFDMSASQEARREPSQGLLGMKERAT
jgi:signal transduction histidine kinase